MLVINNLEDKCKK